MIWVYFSYNRLSMALSIFSLNIERGKHLDRQLAYIKSFPFDIVCLQEVVTGSYDLTGKGVNTLREIQKVTGYQSLYAPHVTLRWDPSSTLGLAILYKDSCILVRHEVFYMVPPTLEEQTEIDWSASPRCVQIAELSTSEGNITVANVHLAWSQKSPDTPERLRQAKILYEFLQKYADKNLVLIGDFNADGSSQMMEWFGELGRNLTREYKVKNTINYNLHRNTATMTRTGLVIDHAFVQKRINVRSFKVIDTPDLSDHYGLLVYVDLP